MGQHVISWREDPTVEGQHKMLPITCGMYMRALEFALVTMLQESDSTPGAGGQMINIIRKQFGMEPFGEQELNDEMGESLGPESSAS